MSYLRDAVESNWIAPVGPHLNAFENELAELLKVKFVLAVNSGTSAIHLGLLALNVERGDEVICSTFTFCGSVNPIIYSGAQPVFVDSENESWNMDPGLLEQAIRDRINKKGRKPKAIILVHLYGMPAKIDAIMEVAARYEIPILEDAAEAFGSLYHGKPVGTFGNAGILSFNGNKIVTTSGGGALFSEDEQVVERARYLRQEAKEPLPFYEHKSIGYNYRLSNLLAAVGRSQLPVLEQRVQKKREIYDFYYQQLRKLPGISFQEERENEDVRSNRWLTAILVENEVPNNRLIQLELEKNHIESRLLWKPMHLQPVFRDVPAYLNGVSEEFFACGLCLPSGTNLSKEDLGKITGIVEKMFSR